MVKISFKGTNISHLGKRKIIFKYAMFWGDMLVFRGVVSQKVTIEVLSWHVLFWGMVLYC